MPRFTDRFLSSFGPAPGAKDRIAFDTECRGLGVRATATGNKVFIVQWTDRATGRKAREPLGTWGALTIEKAREAARIRLGRLAAGFDPKAERDAKRADALRARDALAAAQREAAFTLNVLIDEWAALHLASRRPSYARNAPRQLRRAYAGHLTRPASALTRADVVAVLDRLVKAGTPNAARLALTAGRACYGWAVARERLAGNPFAGLPVIAGAHVARERVLSAVEVGEVWRGADALPPPHGPLVRFLLLTLARREEAGGTTWGEVSADLTTWTQPAARTKNGKAHVVHLSAPARSVLREMLGIGPRDAVPALPAPERLVFGLANGRAVSSQSWMKATIGKAIAAERAKAVSILGKPAADMPGWVFHDFRRSGVTWLAGAGFAPHVADRLLNHVEGEIRGVAAVYQRNEFLPERRAALDAWGAHVLAMAEGKALLDAVADLAAARRKRARGAQ
ncbi:MAG: integrase arm-type DNA-binding domain-containing protein [Alphaproteobacteria bacterium]|nr:integrase arm-type DNA-binding domain-containing protein [Alphaproteobacteria bacterium]